jgi:hypothetical protein
MGNSKYFIEKANELMNKYGYSPEQILGLVDYSLGKSIQDFSPEISVLENPNRFPNHLENALVSVEQLIITRNSGGV